MTKKKPQQDFKPRAPSARTPNQKEYLKAILDYDIVICSGPAGSGKTHIAVGMAVQAFRNSEVNKIVFTRPAIEAGGEKIGFLPGDIDSKMDPFIRPLYDELEKYASYSEIVTWKNSRQLEIVPIGLMRGRTFNNTFLVCDEVQNLEFEQMKMLITRFGQDSIMVLNGDPTQSDLPPNKRGAFEFLCDLFEDDDEIAVVELDGSDNQRHPLVSKMVEKWEREIDRTRTGY